jgi:hypothetical protein
MVCVCKKQHLNKDVMIICNLKEFFHEMQVDYL